MTKNKRLSALGFICLPFICAIAAAGEIRFDGRSFMEGEFKKFERGQVYFKTLATDTIAIDWDHVDSLSTSKNLEIELDSGEILYGTIPNGTNNGQLIVRSADGDTNLQMANVIRITEIDEKIIERFKGTVSAGLDLTKANDYQSYSAGLDMTYTTKRYVSNLNGNYRLNRSEDSPRAEQWGVQIRSATKWKKRRYTGGLLNFYSNQELGVDLRSSIGVAIGKDFISSNSKVFHVDTGLLYTKEDITDSVNTDYSTEAFIGARIDMFRYDVPKLDLTAQLVAIPSLTQSSRIRVGADITMNWEMVKDLYWQLSYSADYDNQPPGQSEPNDDYNLFSGLAYKFN